MPQPTETKLEDEALWIQRVESEYQTTLRSLDKALADRVRAPSQQGAPAAVWSQRPAENDTRSLSTHGFTPLRLRHIPRNLRHLADRSITIQRRWLK